jgi:tetratricopeptide (TPR) repeat protein
MATARPKISRKALKQPDEFMTAAFSVEDFVEHHLQKVLGGVVMVLIVALAAFLIYSHQVTVHQQAAEEFYEGFSALQSKDYKSAEQKFNALILEHPSSEPAGLARFYLGMTYLGTGDLPRAREELERFTQSAAPQSLRELAMMDLGVVYEQLGQYAKAAAIYREAGNLKGPASNDARLAAARALQLDGKRDAAIVAYQDFLKDNPYAPQRDTVVQALANLGVSVPAISVAPADRP